MPRWSVSSAVLLLTFVVAVLGLPGRVDAAAPAAPGQPLATLYVNGATGNDGFNCLAPAAACKTLAGAIAKATADATIQIAAGVYATNDVQVDKSLTIVGAGRDSTILDGGLTSRVLQITGASTLTDLTVRNGRIDSNSPLIFDTGGGGIFSNTALTLRNVALVNNGVTGSGGAIFHLGDLVIEDSQILSNTADGSSGAIYSYLNGTVIVTNTVIAGNQADGAGGAMEVSRPIFLTDVTLRDNSAGTFGGALSIMQSATLNRVALHGNTANSGAAVAAQFGTVELTNVTVSGNVAGNNYGGIALLGAAQLTVRNSTIAYNTRTNAAGTGFNGLINSGGTVTVVSSIIANNEGRNCAGTATNWTSLGYNIASDSSCDFTQASDLQPSEPFLAPLADNGGPTPTHALLPDSPAIDAGDNAQCPAVDQRGIARPIDGDGVGGAVCDRGAFETRSQIVIADRTVEEGDAGTANAVFTVTLTPPATGNVSVNYTTVAGTAAAGSDFNQTAGVLTWTGGQSVKTIAVPIKGDVADEPDETFTVQLSNPVNAELADTAGAGLILDDDGPPALTIDDRSVIEGNTGLTDMVFNVTLSPASVQTVLVNYSTVDGSASGGVDFDAASGILQFSPGQTTKTVTVKIRGDQIDEAAGEAFTVALSNAQDATLFDGNGNGTITDDDIAQLGLVSDPPAVDEGDVGLTPLVFTVTLNRPASFAITVDYFTGAVVGAGHATPDVDYASATGTLTFQPGEVSKQVAVNVVGDLDVETDEDLFLSITNGTVAILGSQQTGLIRNDDTEGEEGHSLHLPLVTR